MFFDQHHRHSYTMSSALLFILLASSAYAVVTPVVQSSVLLGLVNDTSLNPALYRDGGGGGVTGEYAV